MSAGVTRVKRAFYSLMTAAYLAMEIPLALFIINWGHPASVLLFVILSFLFVGASYGLTKEVIALGLGRKSRMATLQTLETRPRVAILYATMNDVVPACLASIQQNYPSDVYVLDDSTDGLATATVDRIAAERGYTVVRREKRRGFKAGAINDWLNEHKSEYQYIVLLDSDSYLPADWVGESLKYAEHASNADVAIFQGLINIWNLDTRFVQTLAPMSKVGQYVWERELANSLDAVFCYGHNAMIRMSALEEIGGFVEGYVSEDFATAVALADRGWHSRFVPLHTYEALPENIRGFIKRQNKWTRGSFEFFGFAKRSSISADRKFHLLQIPLSHVTNVLLPLGMLLTVYGFVSTQADATRFLGLLLQNPAGTVWSVPILRFLIIAGLVSSIPALLVRYLCGIRLKVYFMHKWLSSAVGAISIPHEAKSMLAYFVTGLRTVPVTPKNEEPLSPRDVLSISFYSICLELVLWGGILAWNPLASIFNATWLFPMVASPLIIMYFGGKGSYARSGAWFILAQGNDSARTRDPIGVSLRLTVRTPEWSSKDEGGSRLSPSREESNPIQLAVG